MSPFRLAFPALIAASLLPVKAAVLADYTLVAQYALPTPDATEVSAIAYSRDTNSLFILSDTATYLTEVSLTGQFLGNMYLSGFSDTEALAYYGPGQLLIGEERIQSVTLVDYQDGGVSFRASLDALVLGGFAGNDGVEGITYDPLTGSLWAVKEKSEQAIYQVVNYAGGGTSVVVNPFSPSGLGFGDLSDIYAMSNCLALATTPEAENFLIISQQSKRLVEVNRSGQVVASLDLSFLGKNDLEGVTMDDAGNIYITSESAVLYVFAVPECSSVVLGLVAIPLLGFRRRRILMISGR